MSEESVNTENLYRTLYEELLTEYSELLNSKDKEEGEYESKREIYDNIPYKDIDRYVREDLMYYDQENPCPISLTVLFEEEGHKMFRHYELGPIIGYIVIGYIPKDGDSYGISSIISEIHEDDENWFAPNTPLYMSNAWTHSVIKTFMRMEKWCDEHFFEGFVDGEWVSKILKPIEYEEIFREDGESACPVLGGPNND